MGGHVVRRLLATSDATVRVLTRDPSSKRARALAEQGGDRLQLLAGDLNEAAGVTAAVRGADRIFCNTDFFAAGSVHGEVDQGIRVLAAARAAGVDRFVWSSLDFAAALTGGRTPVPHYDAKAAVASQIHMLRSDEMMRRETDGWYSNHVSVLTTSPYFENFFGPAAPTRGVLRDGRTGVVFTVPLGQGRYPLIALEDIAWFGCYMLDHWQTWDARDLAVTATSLKGTEIAADFEAETGIPAEYRDVPLGELEAAIPDVGHDFANMFRFFQERDLLSRDRDLGMLSLLHPNMMDFPTWLRDGGASRITAALGSLM